MTLAWLIDDDPRIVEAIGMTLRVLGLQTRSFNGARPAAAELLNGKARPDVIFLDINMHPVNGLMFLEFFRHRSEWDSIPVIMLSAEFHDTEKVEADRLGADAFLVKPMTLEEAERALTAVMKRRSGKMGGI